MGNRHTVEGTHGLIEYIEAVENPLSADIGIIRGDKFTWLFDVGFGEAPLAALQEEKGRVNAVISHFHPDHTGNLASLSLSGLYVGANTFKYTRTGTVVDKDIFMEDGPDFHIFPLPSSHAKGSLGMEVNGEFVFVGDALCSTIKSGKEVYNAGILKELIGVLERIRAKYVLISHNMDAMEEKISVIERLKKIYLQREKNNPYIFL